MATPASRFSVAQAAAHAGGRDHPLAPYRATSRAGFAILPASRKAQVGGKADQAIATYQKVLKQDPSNKVALYNLGVIDHMAGRNANAEKNYRAALVSDPNFGPALFNLAILRTSGGGQPRR